MAHNNLIKVQIILIFKDKYYKFNKKGIYTCVICKKALFSSEHKFDSGSGWPAFYDEI